MCGEHVFLNEENFSEGRGEYEFHNRPGSQILMFSNIKIGWKHRKDITDLVPNDRRLAINLTENLGTKKVCANMMRKNLTKDQQQRRKEAFANLLQ
jgi:hypothetical protein